MFKVCRRPRFFHYRFNNTLRSRCKSPKYVKGLLVVSNRDILFNTFRNIYRRPSSLFNIKQSQSYIIPLSEHKNFIFYDDHDYRLNKLAVIHHRKRNN